MSDLELSFSIRIRVKGVQQCLLLRLLHLELVVLKYYKTVLKYYKLVVLNY